MLLGVHQVYMFIRSLMWLRHLPPPTVELFRRLLNDSLDSSADSAEVSLDRPAGPRLQFEIPTEFVSLLLVEDDFGRSSAEV